MTRPIGERGTDLARRPRGRRWSAGAIIALTLGLAVELTLLAAAAGLVSLYRGDAILPGVRAMGVDLGGLTRDQAAATLRDAWQAQPVTLDAGADGTWPVAPDAAGLRLDAEATAAHAYAAGRAPATLAGFRDAVERLVALAARALPVASLPRSALPTPALHEVAPVWRFNAQPLAATLRPIADQLATPMQNARIWITDGRVESSPGSAGRSLDLAATIAQAERDADQLAAERWLQLTVVAAPPRVADVSAAVKRAQTLLSKSVTVQLYDPINDERVRWTADPKIIGGWLALQTDSGGWRVGREAVAAWVQEQAEALGDGRTIEAEKAIDAVIEAVMGQKAEVKLRVLHRERTHTVNSGETVASIATQYGIPYPWIQKANPGLGEMMYVGQKIVIPSADALLSLPVIDNKRIKVSISQQRMWAYENGAVKWAWVVSTGIPSSPTSPGIFQIQSHEANAYAASWDLWMPYFMGIYRPVPDHAFMNGFHGFPTRGDRQLLWTGNLGGPVTYGCILLSTDNALTLYAWAEDGVVVEVTP
ncbi:MAG: L,D-transpeptidase family protein [Chloroflexi bacterium]|nr:L,D-transpeptidase family protein [Chloroflexota bacterium]